MSASVLAFQIRFIAPGPATAFRPVGAAGGKTSCGVIQTGAEGGPSMPMPATVLTVRSAKHCFLPNSAPACRKTSVGTGAPFNGTAADASYTLNVYAIGGVVATAGAPATAGRGGTR